MARTITMIVCSLLALSLAGCREEAFPGKSPSRDGLVTFTAAAGTDTRSTQEGSFEKGDAIGVFAIEPKTGVYFATNSRYTYDGGRFRPATEADNIMVTAGTDFDFYVYYPFKTGQTDLTAISHTVGDQDEKTGWLAADFMTATHTDPVLDYTVPLHFRHRLSTVELRIEGNDGVREATLENVKRMNRFNLLTGGVTTDESREAAGCTGTVRQGTQRRCSG